MVSLAEGTMVVFYYLRGVVSLAEGTTIVFYYLSVYENKPDTRDGIRKE